MNLPKYKIGDKLVAESGYTAVVESISIREDGIYYYGGPAAIGLGKEERLKLYQMPKKKKLYAYMANVQGESRVDFFTTERVGLSPNPYSRVPEYDIEYPEEQA